MTPKVILSLFDFSGEWTAPFADAGHEVITIDVKHDATVHDVRKLSVEYFIEELGIEWVDAIIAAPPCTDFTNSGARHWKAKDADGRTEVSVELVRQVLRSVEFWKPDFWVLENPVGRLPKLVPELGLEKPLIFDPCDFAGNLDAELTPAELELLADMTTWHAAGREFTAEEVTLVKRSNRYTKRTCLWGNFNRDLLAGSKASRTAIRVCDQGSWLQKLGGAGARTKEARSETPRGFAKAFFEAHDWSKGLVKEWNDECGDAEVRELPASTPVELGMLPYTRTIMDADAA